MRLDKYLSHNGYGTRTEVKQLVKSGRVTINDKRIKKADVKVDIDFDRIAVDGDVIDYEPVIYIMLNKPPGVISATEDNRHQTVIDLMPEYSHYELHPVGRLDIDTEGLLILTNDGQFTHNVLSPKKHVDKTYYAQIDGTVTAETITQFNNGVVLDDGYQTMPARLSIIKSADSSEVEIIIQEGKFHQVKRMFEAVGMSVTFLKRIRMGGLPLDEALAAGEYRKLTEQEKNMVFDV